MKKVLVLPMSLLFLLYATQMWSQMESTVNSLADDQKAHPYDDPDTEDFDESIDGFCGDSLGRCTLRAALEEAASIGTSARVVFSVNGTIHMDPQQQWFFPPDDSWIQGYQQNVSILGNGINTPVIFTVESYTLITGLHLANAFMGIVIAGDHNRIGLDDPSLANYITDMRQNGIIITGDSNRVTGNVIGLDIAGAAEGSPFGVFVFGNGNVIGGTHPGEGNVISGNDKGIAVYSLDSLNEIAYIVGNSIGTNIAGTAAVGNKVGIEVTGFNTVIGGNAPEAMNVISGNTESGILSGIQATFMNITGNHIGVDKTGTIMIPNRDGIALGPGSNSCIVENNLIKGNTEFGVFMSGLIGSMDSLASLDHVIFGNDILMNTLAGIGISNNTHDVVIGQTANGGSPNNIQFNGSGGVIFSQTLGTPKYNTIRRNSFRNNNLKGIDILTFCPNCQDQIFPPYLTGYMEADPVTAVVTGTHETIGSIIDIYTGDINTSGRYEGLVWLGSTTVNANHDFILTIDNCQCDIVATATDPQGNTSEFTDGEPIMTAVHDPAALTVTNVYPNPFHETTTIEYTLDQPHDVMLNIYDVTGRKMETLYEGHRPTGLYQTIWNAGAHPYGMYYYRLNFGNTYIKSGKLVYMK